MQDQDRIDLTSDLGLQSRRAMVMTVAHPKGQGHSVNIWIGREPIALPHVLMQLVTSTFQWGSSPQWWMISMKHKGHSMLIHLMNHTPELHLFSMCRLSVAQSSFGSVVITYIWSYRWCRFPILGPMVGSQQPHCHVIYSLTPINKKVLVVWCPRWQTTACGRSRRVLSTTAAGGKICCTRNKYVTWVLTVMVCCGAMRRVRWNLYVDSLSPATCFSCQFPICTSYRYHTQCLGSMAATMVTVTGFPPKLNKQSLCAFSAIKMPHEFSFLLSGGE